MLYFTRLPEQNSVHLLIDDHDLYLTCKLSKCHHNINFSMNNKLVH